MNHAIHRRSRAAHRRAGAVLAAVLATTALSVSTGGVADAIERAPSDAVTSAPPVATAPTPAGPAATEEIATMPDEAAAPDPTVESDAVTPAAPAPAARSTVVAAATTPAVTVTPTSGLNPAGGSSIIAMGSGFHPTANSSFGIYVVFGPVDPGTYFKDANRFLAAMWLHVGGAASGSPGQGELNGDGSFRTSLPAPGGLPLTARYTDGNGIPVDCLATQCYVITMAAHGVDDRSQDTCTPVSFAGGTATPGVDREAGQPVATPTGEPAGPTAAGSPTANRTGNGTNATGTSGSGTGTGSGGQGSGASATLPKTGTGVAGLAGVGLALVAGGLVLIVRDRRRAAIFGAAQRAGLMR